MGELLNSREDSVDLGDPRVSLGVNEVSARGTVPVP